MISVKEAAKKWNVSERRVQKLCNDGRVKGAIKFGRVWMIPPHAVLPKQNKNEKPHLAMPRKTPFLDMTNIYNEYACAYLHLEKKGHSPTSRIQKLKDIHTSSTIYKFDDDYR